MAKQKKSRATKMAGTHVEAKVAKSERRKVVLAATSRVKTKTPLSIAKVRRG